MVDQLGDEFEFKIITSERDHGDPYPYSDIIVDKWNYIDKTHVYYASPTNSTIRALSDVISVTNYDILYLNSFFNSKFTLNPLLARRIGWLHKKPTVIAPRGEFSEGAYELKGSKKILYKWITKSMDLYQGVIWQASSEYEAKDIRRVMGNLDGDIIIAPNLTSMTNMQPHNKVEQRHEPLKVIFLSRISPKKNLDFALRVLACVSVPIEFNIYGPKDDLIYWQECQALIDSMPSHIKVNVMSVVKHSCVAKVLAAHDLFFLPTRGENFGHVVVEALASGTPILLANTTPWRSLEKKGVGWSLSLDNEQQFVDAIEEAANKDTLAYAEWRKRVLDYAKSIQGDESVLNANRNLFLRALHEN
jgi:glycosyltransferase involved in cell wall biosynthesis